MTPNPNLTLPDMFRRFADLTQFWYRHTASSELAQREFQEYSRLLVDIPCQIERLIAFADVGTTAMFDAVAKVRAEPPREDAGQGWRMLELGETIQEGDEYGSAGQWRAACLTETKVMRSDVGHYRRRIAKDTPKDTAGHIQADFEPKREETAKACDCGASEEAWRTLELSETLIPGDEYWDATVPTRNKWVPTTRVGGEAAGYAYRRRATPPSPAKE